MTKDATGVWSVTSDPLEPTVHLYFFTVDGQAIADPINPRMKLRVRTSASLVEVPGTPVPPWQVRDVPHGSVDWNVHHSTATTTPTSSSCTCRRAISRAPPAIPCSISCTAPGDTAMGGARPAPRT